MQKPTKNINILYIDDDLETQASVKKFFEHYGYNIILADGILTGMWKMTIRDIHLVILDHKLPIYSHEEIVKLADSMKIPVVYYTSIPESKSLRYKIVRKSRGVEDLLHAVEYSLSNAIDISKTLKMHSALRFMKS